MDPTLTTVLQTQGMRSDCQDNVLLTVIIWGDTDFNKKQSITARLNSHENFVSQVLEQHFHLCNVLFYCLRKLSPLPTPQPICCFDIN